MLREVIKKDVKQNTKNSNCGKNGVQVWSFLGFLKFAYFQFLFVLCLYNNVKLLSFHNDQKVRFRPQDKSKQKSVKDKPKVIRNKTYYYSKSLRL